MIQRPDWFDEDLFPFESRALEINGSVVHCVDEGEGVPLLMLHGNPTWSFLYRKLIAGLSDTFRCIALDYPGFGLSTAPPGYTYTAAEHSAIVEGFVDQLGLDNIVLVAQDWGGPIGLSVATRQPERFQAFVIGNTWAWPFGDDPRINRFSSAMGGDRSGELLVQRFNVFVNVFLKTRDASPQTHRSGDGDVERPVPDGRIPASGPGVPPRDRLRGALPRGHRERPRQHRGSTRAPFPCRQGHGVRMA